MRRKFMQGGGVYRVISEYEGDLYFDDKLVHHISASDKGKTLEIKMPSKKTYTVSVKNPIIPSQKKSYTESREADGDVYYEYSDARATSASFSGGSAYLQFIKNWGQLPNYSSIMGSQKTSVVRWNSFNVSGKNLTLYKNVGYNIYTITRTTTYINPLTYNLKPNQTITIELQSTSSSKREYSRYEYDEIYEKEGIPDTWYLTLTFDGFATGYNLHIEPIDAIVRPDTSYVNLNFISKEGYDVAWGGKYIINAVDVKVHMSYRGYNIDPAIVSIPNIFICEGGSIGWGVDS